MKMNGILMLLVAYMFGIFTLAQFCESKVITQKSIAYRLYILVISPITIVLKLFHINFIQVMKEVTNNMNNGRSYIITCFYYLLYVVSMFLFYKSATQQVTIIFPHEDPRNNKIQWALLPTKKVGTEFVSPILIIITLVLHILSLIAFTTALMRNSVQKSKAVQDGILYNDQLCKSCKQKPHYRSQHCEQCKSCIVKRDHHCIWINRCVGRRNLLWFIIFLNATAYACLLVALLNINVIIDAFMLFPSPKVNMLAFLQTKTIGYKIILLWVMNSLPSHVASCFIHLMIAIMLIPFGFVHLIQALRNRTSAEIQKIYYIKQDLIYSKYQLCEAVGKSEKALRFVIRQTDTNMDEFGEDLKYKPLQLKDALKAMNKYSFYNKGLIGNIMELVSDGFD